MKNSLQKQIVVGGNPPLGLKTESLPSAALTVVHTNPVCLEKRLAAATGTVLLPDGAQFQISPVLRLAGGSTDSIDILISGQSELRNVAVSAMHMFVPGAARSHAILRFRDNGRLEIAVCFRV